MKIERRRLVTLTPIFFLGISLALISLSVSSRGVTTIDAAALETVGPVSSSLNRLAKAVENLWLSYFSLAGLKKENEGLRETLERQNAFIVQLGEARLANERLTALLDLKEESQERYIAAKVVAWDPGPWAYSLVINKGSNHGVKTDAAVISLRGAVGRVTEISPNFSKVLLISDIDSGVDAFVQRNRVNGLISGGGAAPLTLDYVRKNDDVRPGDQVVTSGLDGVFPSGLPIGLVTLVDKMSLGLFLTAEVSPAVDFSSLEEVLVLSGPRPPFDWLAFGGDLKYIIEKKNLGRR
ncbi:MAG: rod shape-determining protein MreC [Deltaproteobacteria bacterium]|nr:rod shape-determining protein MreC [Deltaproteobacteria bacterium]